MKPESLLTAILGAIGFALVGLGLIVALMLCGCGKSPRQMTPDDLLADVAFKVGVMTAQNAICTDYITNGGQAWTAMTRTNLLERCRAMHTNVFKP